MDRNFAPAAQFRWGRWSLSARRAWIEIDCCVRWWENLESLSARRAWIEISIGSGNAGKVRVALRKESVDRNFGGSTACCAVGRSLSARRAWIEIITYELTGGATMGRSPQGERG